MFLQTLETERAKFPFFQGSLFTIITYDMNPSNIVWKNKKPRIFDWETASVGDPAMEIARIFDSWNLNERQKDLFMREYGGDNQLKLRINTYQKFVSLTSLTYYAKMHFKYKDNKKIAGNFYKRFINKYKQTYGKQF